VTALNIELIGRRAETINAPLPADLTWRASGAPGDRAFLFALYESTRAFELALWGWDRDQQQEFVRIQYERLLRAYQVSVPYAEHRIILWGERPIGQLIVDSETDALTLIDISLVADARNLGIGTLMLRLLQEESRVSGRALRAEIRKDNPLGSLLRRLDFRKTAEDEYGDRFEWADFAPSEGEMSVRGEVFSGD
jgi:ribosomal protein S18 acetylase RimI-like enzyme